MAAAAAAAWGFSPAPRRALRCLLALLAMAAPPPAGAGLYQAGVDPVWVLEGGAVREALRDSASAWLLQFYSSSCGHCVAFAPTWRALAGDVHGEPGMMGEEVQQPPFAMPSPEPPAPSSPATFPRGKEAKASPWRALGRQPC